MTAGQIADNKSFCRWKTKTNTNNQENSGLASVKLVVLLFLFLAGFYIWSVNGNAVKGLQLRQVEEEISRLKKENEKLRLQEAQLKSLYNIEESTKETMTEIQQVSYLEEKGSVAMK